MSEADMFQDMMVRVRGGDNDAAAMIFRRFVHRLIALASRQFAADLRHRVDVEDLVQSVFKSFFVRMRQGQFDLADWDGLWGLLTRITVRKCQNLRRDMQAMCRDIRREVAALPDHDRRNHDALFLDREPSPEEVAMLAETVDELVRGWEQPEREVAELILMDYAAWEIAARSGCSERTVRRLRRRLKDRLEQMRRREFGHDPSPGP